MLRVRSAPGLAGCTRAAQPVPGAPCDTHHCKLAVWAIWNVGSGRKSKGPNGTLSVAVEGAEGGAGHRGVFAADGETQAVAPGGSGASESKRREASMDVIDEVETQ